MSNSVPDDKVVLISSNENDETLDDSQPKPIVKQPSRQAIPLQQSEDWISDTLETLPEQPQLEYLRGLDHLFIYQKVHLLGVFTTWVTNNDYTIKNDANDDTLLAVEKNHCLIRNLLYDLRPFEMKVFDSEQRELFYLSRPLRCVGWCFPCFQQELTVTTPFGHVIAYVNEEWSFHMPKLRIQLPSGETVLRIEGPVCPCSMFCHVEFVVTSEDGSTELGRIIKRWSGWVLETFTHADHFEITFPVDLDVNMKAALVGACLLIDYMYFE